MHKLEPDFEQSQLEFQLFEFSFKLQFSLRTN